MFKLALSAGHWVGTYKGCPKSLDPNQTDEWTLNSRICNKMQAILNDYDGIEVLRTDDTTGKTNILLADRCKAANKWKANFYLSIHHNGGINGGKGGGIVAFIHPNASKASKEWQTALYDAAVAATGLRGNRANPKPTKNLQEMREANMPSVLMECGFMDSATDCPIILTEEYADKIAQAFCDVIIERSGATKKVVVVEPPKVEVEEVPEVTEQPEVVEKVEEDSTTPIATVPPQAAEEVETEETPEYINTPEEAGNFFIKLLNCIINFIVNLFKK